MYPFRQSRLLRRVMLPGPVTSTGTHEPMLEMFSVEPSVGPPPVDHRPVVSLALRGQLCRFSVREIRPMVLDLASDAMDVMLDLHDVTFLDVGAIRFFTEIHARVTRHGGRLVLEGVSSLGRRIITICGLDDEWLRSSPGCSSPGRPRATTMREPAAVPSGRS